jgi:hypothetical protein
MMSDIKRLGVWLREIRFK